MSILFKNSEMEKRVQKFIEVDKTFVESTTEYRCYEVTLFQEDRFSYPVTSYRVRRGKLADFIETYSRMLQPPPYVVNITYQDTDIEAMSSLNVYVVRTVDSIARSMYPNGRELSKKDGMVDVTLIPDEITKQYADALAGLLREHAIHRGLLVEAGLRG